MRDCKCTWDGVERGWVLLRWDDKCWPRGSIFVCSLHILPYTSRAKCVMNTQKPHRSLMADGQRHVTAEQQPPRQEFSLLLHIFNIGLISKCNDNMGKFELHWHHEWPSAGQNSQWQLHANWAVMQTLMALRSHDTRSPAIMCHLFSVDITPSTRL